MYVNNTEQQGVILICDGSTFSCSTTLVGLGAYILHNIEVSCSTRVGEGPRTNNITIRTSIGSEFRVVIITFIPTQRHKLYFLDTKLVDNIINSYTKLTKHYIPHSTSSSVLEITVSHWPFSDQFQHLADHNLFDRPYFPYIFNETAVYSL